ncbi:MAG: TrkA C-terminal domain-containing protein [Chloroflexota bacterium]
MAWLYLLLPALLTVVFSFIIVRVGAIALMRTGLDYTRASFQALSAFSRAGFTTKEAELVLSNPQRRRIIAWLIVLGNAGFIAIVVTGTSALTASEGYEEAIVVLALLAAVYLMYRIITRKGLISGWERTLERRFLGNTGVREGAPEDLLHLTEGYGLAELEVTENCPVAGKSLREANTKENEFWVLGIERGRQWLSLPHSSEAIRPHDRLVMYGELKTLRTVFCPVESPR